MISEALIRAKISKGNTLGNGENFCSSIDHNARPYFTPSSVEPIHLDLSFQRIERTDNLAGFGTIISLVLNNNRIKTIAGLQTLVHLKKLDLSFNEITKIEGLSTLVELEDLSLYHNQIENITGLDKCFRLKSLSLGLNEISDIGNVFYIRHLKQLRDLVLIGNPIAEQQESKHDYRPRVLSVLKQLKYLDNAKVAQDDANGTADEAGKESSYVHETRWDKLEANPVEEFTECPIDKILISCFGKVEQQDNKETKLASVQCRGIVNDYIQKLLELKDEFLHHLQHTSEAIQLRTHERIEEMIKVTSKKDDDADADVAFDLEIDLSNKNQHRIAKLKENHEEKFIQLIRKVKEKTILLLSEVTNSLLKTIEYSRPYREEDSKQIFDFEDFNRLVKIELERIEQDEIEEVKSHVKMLLLDTEAKENFRTCQISDIELKLI